MAAPFVSDFIGRSLAITKSMERAPNMKNRALVVGLALSAMTLASAFAQTVVIKPEQETQIREYVTTHKAAPAEVTGVEIAIGATLPESVELHPLEVPDMEYRYVMVDGHTALVDPGTRKIVHIIE